MQSSTSLGRASRQNGGTLWMGALWPCRKVPQRGSPFKQIVVQGYQKDMIQTLQISLVLGFLLQPHLSTRYLEENPRSF